MDKIIINIYTAYMRFFVYALKFEVRNTDKIFEFESMNRERNRKEKHELEKIKKMRRSSRVVAARPAPSEISYPTFPPSHMFFFLFSLFFMLRRAGRIPKPPAHTSVPSIFL